jgi:hypothetical protein
MRRDVLATAFAFAGLVGAPAQAALNISTQPTQNVTCSGGTCTATNSIAFLNVNDLATMLAAGDVAVSTGTISNDIKVEAPVSWASATRLTLDAHRSIEFKRSVTVAGTGGALTLITNDNGGSGGDYWFDNSANVTFWDTASSLVINGQSFTLVKDIATLASAIAANPSGNFALAANYDASGKQYVHPPVPTPIKGIVEGLGNDVSKLSINASEGAAVGLFKYVEAGGVVRDLRMSGTQVTDNNNAPIGALVGSSFGTIARDEVRGGSVSLTGDASGNIGYVGGLAGFGSVIVLSTSSAKVTAVQMSGAPAIVAGGLAGSGGTISQSSASGNVIGAEEAGGLAGYAQLVQASHATGAVSSAVGCLGGLVSSGASIVNSYATGAVTTGDGSKAGGLACEAGHILDSFASAKVAVGNTIFRSALAEAGGLVASTTSGTVEGSFSTGDVTGGRSAEVGGLMGEEHQATTSHSYATGIVTGDNGAKIGGLVGGRFLGTLQQVYSIGQVQGTQTRTRKGGLIGSERTNNNSETQAPYWDIDTSDAEVGCGVGDCTGITGLSDSQLKAALPDGFDPVYWGQSPSINNGYPYLLANPPPPATPATARLR